jgi:hypothetical protein
VWQPASSLAASAVTARRGQGSAASTWQRFAEAATLNAGVGAFDAMLNRCWCARGVGRQWRGTELQAGVLFGGVV